MIKLIGFKRLVTMAVLLGINAVVGGVYMTVVDPMRLQTEMAKAGLLAQIADLQGKIQNIKQEVADFHKNLPRYEELKTRGFFLEQDRFRMGRDLDAVRTASGIKAFSYNIADIKDVPNIEATQAQMRIISSRIDVSHVSLVTDEEFYKFIDLMQEQFPTQLRLQSFQVRRANELTPQALASMAEGKKVDIIDATVIFDWMTMVPMPPTADPNIPQGQVMP